MPDASSLDSVREFITVVGIPATITLALIYFVLRPVALRLTTAGEVYLSNMAESYKKLVETFELMHETISQTHTQVHAKLDRLLENTRK